jgi:adenylate kinase family enzyme
MSIPLDHIVFEDKIDTQLKINNQNFIIGSKNQMANILNLKEDSVDAEQARQNAANAQKQIENPCRIPEYLNKKKEEENLNINELPKLANALRKSTNALFDRKKELWQIQTPDSIKKLVNAKIIKPNYNNVDTIKDVKYNNLLEKKKAAYSEFKITDDLVWKLRKDADKIFDDWYSKNELKKNKSLDRAEKLDSIKIEKQRKIDSLNIANQTFVNLHNGFDVKFKTLFLMPDFAVQFLKWLIFLALLVIEILPTFLKLKTPIGQYDLLMHQAEDDTRDELKKRSQKYQDTLEEIEEYRKNKEIEMNKKLIDKVVSIEERLANEMLEEWEIKARAQMKNNVEKS